jgi:FkbM family methyltransferase
MYYSQFGEDKIISDYIKNNLPSLPKLIVEVGAADIEVNSNSRYFIEEEGFKAILFEPQKKFYDSLLAFYSNSKQVEVINQAVADANKEYSFNDGDDLTLNGIKSDGGNLVSGTTLKQALTDRGIDFSGIGILSLDTEGYEVPILKSIFKDGIFPKIVLSESNSASNRNSQFKIMKANGYKLYIETACGFFNNSRKDKLLDKIFNFLPFERNYRGVNAIWVKQ